MEDENSDASSNKAPSVSQVVEQLKELWGMTLPVTTMNFLVFLRQVVSVLFLGRIGSLELAGGALAIGFTNITGYSVMVGLAAGLEPICSQAYGSKNWDLLCLSLQRMILILLVATIPIAFLWINLDNIMVFLGQDPQITGMAAIYCIYSLPDLLTNTLLQPLKTFLRSQKDTKPMMYCTLVAVGLHVPLNYVMVVVLGLGTQGVAIASVLTNMNIAGLMSGYVWVWGRKGEMRWTLKVGEVCGGVGPVLKLAVPSCLGICLEWWWYEIVTVLSGYLSNPTSAVAATGILIQTTSMMYTVPLALAGCVSARVGNELGSGKPKKAKVAAVVALGCAFVIGGINVTWTVILRRTWARLFTDDSLVQSLVSSALPIIGLCELWNCPQTTGYGILRGTARPAVGARINLGCFYLVGTPVAVGLAFGVRVGFVGLWFGLLSAQVACAVSMLYVVLAKTDWEGEVLKAKKLTGLEMSATTNGNGAEEETRATKPSLQIFPVHSPEFETMSKEVTEEGQSSLRKDYVDPPPAPLIDVAELTLWSFYRALIAEFIASLLFLYVTIATVIGNSKQTKMCDGVGILGIAWAFGGMIFVLVYCTAGISGGHINPAVTFGLFLARKVSLIRAVGYMVAQCAGAVVGVGLVKAFMKHDYNNNGGGANAVNSGYSRGTALGAEIIGTFVLVYTVFSATDPKRSARDSHIPVLAPLPIGFAVFMVHLATIPITGTGINPARSFGAAVIYNREKPWNDHWIFWVGPFVGALAAAAYHQYILRAAAIKALGSFRSNPTN